MPARSHSSSKMVASAMSADGSLAAIEIPSNNPSRHLVQVFAISNNSSFTLQLTLTHTTTSSDATSCSDLVFCNSNTLIGRFGTSEYAVWDLDRGVVVHKVLATDDQSFWKVTSNNDNDTESSDERYHVLTNHGPKLYLYEYNIKYKLVRKIKCGRFDETSNPSSENDDGNDEHIGLAVSKSHVAVSTVSGGIRIMDLQTGQKVGKIKNKGGNANVACYDLQFTPSASSLVALYQGSIVWYSLQGKPQGTIPHSLDNESGLLQVDGSYLVANSTLYKMDGRNKKAICQMETKFPFALYLTPDGSHKILALMYQKKNGGCKARWVDPNGDDELSSKVDLDEEVEEKTDGKKDEAKGGSSSTSSSKRKMSEPLMMGPGQAGVDAPLPKRSKAGKDEDGDVAMDTDGQEEGEDDEEQEVTIGERLKQLTSAMEDEYSDDDDDAEYDGERPEYSFKPKKATTESLKELLTQALQSSDDALLELALGVNDAKIISKTLQEIEPTLMVSLLSKLTARLASSPMRANQLAIWLSYCLKRGSFTTQQLSTLRNLIFERIESFSDLLKLEGRLSMMCDVE